MAFVQGSEPGSGSLARVPSGGLVIGAIASVQFGAAIAATLFSRVGPGGAVLLRLASASIVLGALWRPRVRDRSGRQLRLAFLFGAILAGMNLTFYEALDRIPLGIAVAVEFVGPLTVAVLGSRRRLDLVWIVLAAAGIVALTRGRAHGLDALGLLYALLAGALWGCYIVVNARIGRAFEGASGLTLAMWVAALIAVPFGIADAGGHLLHAHSLLLGAAVGVLSSAIPYSFELEALRRIAQHVFGVLMSLEPAVAALAGFVVLGQSLSARALLGITLVIVASAGAARGARAAPVAVQ
ncbi:MAG TPA: EamA family transporter [Solirubrobacteraceae bacterium]|nr:EamA family transporter [Solirubrobacteraceae bacterium]